MRVAVLSDSHWQNGRALPGFFQMLPALGLSGIIHCGDICSLSFLDELEKIAPVHAVAGNCDSSYIHDKLGRKKIITFAGVNIGIIHGDGVSGTTPDRARLAFAHDDVQVVTFGHSHAPYCEEIDDRLIFNPGSCTRPRGMAPQPSFGLLSISEGQVSGKIVYISAK